MKLSIGEVAKQSQVGVETVRFYEREGLLPRPLRKASGYRQYDEEAVRLLRFIRRAKQLGFTLKEIKSLLALRATTLATRADVRSEANEKLRDIDEKIQDLTNMRSALQKLVNSCHGKGSARTCPILEALDREPEIESHEEK